MIARTTLPSEILKHLDRPVAVWGMGSSGIAAAGLLAARGVAVVLYDERNPDADRSRFGPVEAEAHGLVVFSPGFPSGHPWFSAAAGAGCECLSELDFASLFWPGPILAVTGTNGKTTLTELLTCALGRAGIPAVATGNIGAAFCRMATCIRDSETYAVCEVSSFQASSLGLFSPDWTLWTNFAEDHLERHGSMRSYFEAKKNLIDRTPSGQSVYGSGVLAYSDENGCGLNSDGMADQLSASYSSGVSDTPFATGPQRENLILAAALWERLGLGKEALIEACRSFRIGDHRLRRIATVAGVEFWDDSKATNFHACESALKQFERPVLWIGGGKSKGGDLERFADRIAPRIRQAALMGETGPAMSRLLGDRGVSSRIVPNLHEAIGAVTVSAAVGDRVVLSPAFSSLDMFDGYADRGQAFSEAVRLLATESISTRSQ